MARVEWTDDQIEVLVDERKKRNLEYWYHIPGRSRQQFWEEISEVVNIECGSNFTGKQCQNKFNTLVSDYHVRLV